MIHKKRSKLAMRYSALKKENLRLERKILTLEAKDVTTQNELRLRPPYSAPQPRDKRLSVAAIKKWVEKLPRRSSAGDEPTA